MCLSVVISLPTKCVGLVQSGYHHYVEMSLVLAMIWLKKFSLGIKQELL